ncbi:MAG: Holliday junction resolvase RuvX [Firmicutes bacterium]|nr:Holliday junction resolvase RuvX [Bacillota bacterium]
MDRMMGLDVGDKTIGIAVSDPLGLTAQGVTTIRRKAIKSDIKKLESLIDEYNVKLLVVGLPKNMNNTLGPQGEKVKKFIKRFKKRNDIKVVYQDERLSSVSAERTLINGNMSRQKRKGLIDKVAATYILQTYLEKLN